MKCPACGKDTRVSNSRPNDTIVRRRRICTDKKCRNRFSTVERLALKCKVLNRKGRQENFDEAKLHRSVLLGLYDLPQPIQQNIADRVVDGITADLSGRAVSVIGSAELREKVGQILEGIDEWLANRYRFTAPSPNRDRMTEESQRALFVAAEDDDD